MISVTGDGLSRACSDDRFSTYSRFACRAAARDRPSCNERTSSLHPITRDALGLEDELFFTPVVVMDIGAIETLNHLGGAGAGFDSLEDAEGNERAASFVVQAVHVDDEGDVGEGLGEVEGVDEDLPDVVPPADVGIAARVGKGKLLSPARRHDAVNHLSGQGFSQRLARARCRAVAVSVLPGSRVGQGENAA